MSYTYDEDNRRISKTIGTETIQYHYDGDSIDVLYETDGSGNILRQYVYSDDNIRLAMKMNGKTLYYHYNAHGDVVALTDEAGKTAANYEYDAWGNVLKSEATTSEAKANPYGYAGYTYDKEIQQYYLMARYYEPAQGVFTAIDPDPGDDDDPQTMNGYNYANNNPVMFVDPDGHWIQLVPLAIGAAKIAYKYRKPIAKYGKKAWKYTRVKSKRAWRKTKRFVAKFPYRIHKVGLIKGAGDKGRGYPGFIYSKKKNKKRTYRSWEIHTPHNDHGWHFQSNKYSRYNGKWRRSSKKTKRWTFKKARNWR